MYDSGERPVNRIYSETRGMFFPTEREVRKLLHSFRILKNSYGKFLWRIVNTLLTILRMHSTNTYDHIVPLIKSIIY